MPPSGFPGFRVVYSTPHERLIFIFDSADEELIEYRILSSMYVLFGTIGLFN